MLVAGSVPGVRAQQMAASLDLGASLLRYSDSVTSSAAALSPSIDFQSRHLSLDATGTIAELSTGSWTGQGSATAGVFSPAFARFRGELGGSAGGSAHEDGARTGELEGLARLHYGLSRWGLWGGGGAGRAWDGTAWRSVVFGDAGVWLSSGTVTLSAAVTPTEVGDSIHYTDVGLSGEWNAGRAQLEGTLGARSGHGLAGPAGSTAWGSLAVALWVAPHMAIVASGGSYAADLTQALPNGRFVSLAVRLSAPARSLPGRQRPMENSPQANAAGVAQKIVAMRSDSMVIVRVLAPGATRVEIRGDLTNWLPLELAPAANGWWSARIVTAPGAYQVSIRLDDGDWTVPPGLIAVTDEFGGVVGVLVAP